MGNTTKNLQEIFLNSIRVSRAPVTVYLVNGVKLQGLVTKFDSFSLLLKRDNQTQLVYKHAVSTIMPTVRVKINLEETLVEEEKVSAPA